MASRYRLRSDALNSQIEELLTSAQAEFGEHVGAEFVRQMMVTAMQFLRDGTDAANVKLTNSALKELRHSFRVFAPYEHVRKVSVFGSARTKPGHPEFEAARDFAQKIVAAGWMVITGAGDGIMGAAQGGAGRKRSFGVNIRLPFEQRANETIDGDHKLINFRYFFTRKVMFVKESHAIALFPGGFGTHDEGFEALTLIQTGKSEIVPVVYVDAKGGSYWKDWEHYVKTHLHDRKLISEEDLALFHVTDDVDEAIYKINNFYSNYHSSRYVRDKLVMRVRTAPNAEQLDALNNDFADLLANGTIETSEALPAEEGEVAHLPRIVLTFNRHAVGRLRMMIDRVNTYVTDRASPPREAAPHAINPAPLSDEAKVEEQDEE